jgi:SAM-dependent methyltransferase
LPFGDAQFDLVYAGGLLEDIEELLAVLAELSRVCRLGGRVVVGSANKVSIARHVMRLMRRVKPHPLSVMRRSIVMRTVDELEAAGRDAALKFDLVCWTHLPFRWTRYSVSARNVFAPLASNVYMRFVKLPRASDVEVM